MRRGWLVVIGLLSVTGPRADAQTPPTMTAPAPVSVQPSPAAAPGSPPTTAPAPATPVGFGVPGGKDYFGPPLSSKFDEKSVFPDPPPAIKKAQEAQKLPPPKPIVLSDGTVLPPPPPPPPPPKLWTGGAEFGINGSQGNADVFNLRLGANVDRKSDDN